MDPGDEIEIAGVAYTLESLLGGGGGGEVWKVRSADDGRSYALKRIRKSAGGASPRDVRFRNEIAFGVTARHPNVVRVLAQSEEPRWFHYTMNYYPENLRDVIARETDERALLHYLTQICDGLAYVHDREIAHRDLKPENILVDPGSGSVVIADFGIAHFKDSSLTQPDDLLANRNYQAPEQMVVGDALEVGQPADVFALGLMFTEAFTKENARGSNHLRVGHVHPYLTEVDLLVDRMMLQSAAQRPRIHAVRDALHVIRSRTETDLGSLADEVRDDIELVDPDAKPSERLLSRAASDILSGAQIFERATNGELDQLNHNYHCDLSFSVSTETFNACFQARLYDICKSKFEYEALSEWRRADIESVVSTEKAELERTFVEIQDRYPVDEYSPWGTLPSMARQYFRWCKDYHCRELIERALEMETDAGPGSLADDLRGAPVMWLAEALRRHLTTDLVPLSSPESRARVGFTRHVSLDWAVSRFDDPKLVTLGSSLFEGRRDLRSAAAIIAEFENAWDASTYERGDGRYAVYFRSRDELHRFKDASLARSSEEDILRADTLDLLRPTEQVGDLVMFVWEPVFDIPNTLAKVLGMRDG